MGMNIKIRSNVMINDLICTIIPSKLHAFKLKYLANKGMYMKNVNSVN